MQLEWLFHAATDSDGDRYHVHYLIDRVNQQCLATVAEPRQGNLIYATDLKISGYDRSWMTLEAAKEYCECTAELENLRAAKELRDMKVLPPESKPEATLPVSLFRRIFGTIHGLSGR